MENIEKAKIPAPNGLTLLYETSCDCEETVKIYEAELMGGPKKGQRKEFRFGCKCEEKKLAKEAQEQLKRLKHSKAMQAFDRHSLVNRALSRATFDNYETANESQERALRNAKKFVEKFHPDKPINLYYSGDPGLGKSHLSVSIANAVMEKGRPAIFISVPKLLRKIRNTYNKNSDVSEDQLFSILEQIDLLVLDDIGAENRNDWVEEKLFDLIDNRQGRSTIYTSNYGPDELKKLMGERDASRIINEDAYTIELKGDNYRTKGLRANG
ncbi:ATP-binding protein [Marinococcus luteus]|uniref:ATP-binding protein n=1 Tax=Marinococcus luteus TaxID=1122204 RepID=UPI002ACC6F19|nr:ATP-binding protein [Marinococcus luteus]MDZ5782082.1 ATP-binding protein [Marinococcus luteus]